MIELEELLLERFGFPGFRPGQKEIVSHVTDGRDALVVMPTGAGKSLCYQVPAVAMGGLTVVVSPLIALMKDQVDFLVEKGIKATFLNSTLSRAEYEERRQAIAAGDVELLYVAPERFSPAFTAFIAGQGVRLLAVDEAHCLSQWGHDFRPDYLRLGQVRTEIGNPPTVALTATATPEVQKDIVETLRLQAGRTFVRGFDRENLILDVMHVSGKHHKLALLPELVQPGPALVYCATRKRVEECARALRDAGVAAGYYHAGLTKDDRTRVQDDFMSGRLPVVVATNAFGMGIDKRDIRCIIHIDIPGTVEAYYQEIGRAGRDGRNSRAVLLWHKSDRRIQQFFIDNSHPPVDWVHAVWDWLLDREESPVFRTAEEMAVALPPDAGPRSVSACLYQLQREGRVRRIAASDRPAEVLIAPELPRVSPSGLRGRIWGSLMERGVTVSERLSFRVADWARDLEVDRAQMVAALRGLEDRGFLTYVPADRRPGFEIIDRDSPLALDEKALRKRRNQEYAKLDKMVDYTGSGCRRRYVIEYFGEKAPWPQCGTCDQCRAGAPVHAKPRALSPAEEEVTRMLLATVARMDKQGNQSGWSVDLIAKVATGSRDAKLLSWGFEKTTTYGLFGPRGNQGKRAPGRAWNVGEVADLVAALVDVGALAETYVTREIKGRERTYKEISLTEKGWRVMRGQEDGFRLSFPHSRKLSSTREAASAALDDDLLDQLREVRRTLSRADDVPAYVVAPNRALEDMAKMRPTTKKALGTVHGMGPRRVAQYGPHFLEAIRAWNVAR